MKLILGVDLDNTLADTQTAIVTELLWRQVNEAIRQRATGQTWDELHSLLEMYRRGDYWMEDAKKTGIDKDDLLEIFLDPTFWRKLVPQFEVIAALQAIKAKYGQKLKIVIVTRRNDGKGIYEATEEWLKMAGVPYDSLALSPSNNKIEILTDLGVNVFIEDLPNYVKEYVDTLGCSIVLIDKPWNQEVKCGLDERIIRSNPSDSKDVLTAISTACTLGAFDIRINDIMKG